MLMGHGVFFYVMESSLYLCAWKRIILNRKHGQAGTCTFFIQMIDSATQALQKPGATQYSQRRSLEIDFINLPGLDARRMANCTRHFFLLCPLLVTNDNYKWLKEYYSWDEVNFICFVIFVSKIFKIRFCSTNVPSNIPSYESCSLFP